VSREARPKRAGVWENLGPSVVDLEAVGRETNAGSTERKLAHPIRALVRGAIFLVVIGFGSWHVAGLFGFVRVPEFLRSPLVTLLVAFLVIHVIYQTYTEALRSLAFYGRFIRPGLKRLLEEEGGGLAQGEKVFRGRKTVIMKIDMANYTRTTFTMPYGMRRLFQDLWFTLIDQVVADKVFLDKSLGDGSVYCFEGELPGGSATVALATAIELRDRQVRRFDKSYRERLRQRLAEIPELAERAETYLESYRERWGASFWDRRTEIRIALAAGYVDEGLWGLSAQSHYDVQGQALVLATRMEARAQNGEIVFDRAFFDELEEESPGLLDPEQLESRQVEFKGIGKWEILALPRGVDPFSSTTQFSATTSP